MNIFLTVDVECYRGNYLREVDGFGEGLPCLLEILRRHEARAVFFVEALGATRWGPGPLRDLCARIMDGGHEVHLHVHPVVARLAGFRDRTDVLHLQTLEMQTRLLAEGVAVLRGLGAGVSAFRAGDLAADLHTLEAMRRNGLTIGSNRDMDRKSSIRTKLNEVFPVPNDLSEYEGIRDLPVSVVRSPLPVLDGPYRHLQFTAMGAGEMVAALTGLASAGTRCATLLLHPQELFIQRGGRIEPNWKNRRRLERVLAWIGRSADHRLSGIADAAALPLPARPAPIPRGSLRLALCRVAEQIAARGRAWRRPVEDAEE